MNLMLSIPGCKFKLPVSIEVENGRLRFNYRFNREMNAEIKAMQGAKYHGFEDENKKYWTVDNSARNWFNIKYMAGENVFYDYEKPIIQVNKDILPKEIYQYQVDGAAEVITRRRQILAWDTGVGKTLTLIAVINLLKEQFEFNDAIWWIGTNSSLREMPGQFKRWGAKLVPNYYSYDELKRVMSSWTPGRKAPRLVIFDEFSKCKGWTTQRTEAARALSESVETDWGGKGLVIGMTGTPSPKDPTDWYSLCEIIKPGFIKEGNPQKFKQRLALVKSRQGDYGVFPELITWWDDENKCAQCGQLKEHMNHDNMVNMASFHEWLPSVNEIKKLYTRLKGLVSVKFKKDVLSFLPDLRIHTEILKPNESTLRAAKTILNTSSNTISGLIKLRELSDGFQYIEKPEGNKTCETCSGTGKMKEYYNKNNPEEPLFDIPPEMYDSYAFKMVMCLNCKGSGQAVRYVRDVKEVSCPKEEYFIDLLEKHEDSGRFVTYAGFTGSIDRCVNIAHKAGWAVIRVDARGWQATDFQGNVIDVTKIFNKDDGDCYLQLFQNGHSLYPRVCYVAHAKSGGMGVTLTASCGVFWYSITFDGEDYIQGNNRIHRPGMDINKGATVYRCVHLPTDQMIIDNVEKKIKLQDMSLGKFAEVING